MTSKRAKLLAELFGDSRGFLSQAKILKFSQKLHFIPDDELINFAIFVDNFRGNFISTDLAVHKAAIAWQKMAFERVKNSGKSFFKGVNELIAFCKEAYRGEGLCSCEKGSGFLPFVVIVVDDEGNLRNSAVVNESGVFKRLDSSESAKFYNWLFNNQHKIGDIKRISRDEWEQNELNEARLLPPPPKSEKPRADKKAIEAMIEKSYKRIKNDTKTRDF
ncbi:hypothetical protein [Campylobacter gastrosuis]|uniref:Uncharacterized protein n=1 Tax=Campylobacter gastrosuis TaxID=2974576 RepID=A0ABT7HQT8_9BACT|nr:hypothetical protein [Campylobacter gastrosuis]MDL0089276.1 hypothetical protein [Campylobacter gastrosuis]